MSTYETDAVEQLPGVTGAELARQVDALSLNQALIDFEMANARVLDLTARLVEANERVVRFGRQAAEATEAAAADRSQVEGLKAALALLTAELDALRSERAAVDHELGVLRRELDAHRDVIAARDRDAAMLHGEIAARDEVIRVRTNELAALRGSRSYRIVSRVASIVRRVR